MIVVESGVMHINILILIVIGVISGAYGMMVGAGGGFIFVPALLLIMKMPPELAAGTGLVIVVLNTLSGVFGFIKQGRIDYEFAMYLTYGAIPGSLIGVWLARIVSADLFYIIFATFLIGMGIFLILKNRRSKNMKQQDHMATMNEKWKTRIQLILFGIFMGILASFFGIGGGWLMVPLLIYVFHMNPHRATATSVFSLCIYSLIGVGTHIISGHVVWEAALWGGLGALIGAQIGVVISSRLSGRRIVQLLSILLIGVGVSMIV